MGMDVYGKAPTTKAGEYFCNNVWYWRPLAIYCQHIAPAVCAACKGWHVNDGDGLNAVGALALADALQEELDSGDCAIYAAEYKREMDAIPDESCKYCGGTGDRKDLEPPKWKAECGGCNVCHGKGVVRPFETHYPFTVENVREFVEFLRGCGGFKIC